MAGRVSEELVDHSHLVFLHYHIALLKFLSDEEAVLLVALCVDFW